MELYDDTLGLHTQYNEEASQERLKEFVVTIHEAQLRLDLLGPPQVRLGDRLLTFPTRKTLALLICPRPQKRNKNRTLSRAFK